VSAEGRGSVLSGGGIRDGGDCRITKVKVKTSSSSLDSLRMKAGPPAAVGTSRSCTNSKGRLSPRDRDADTLVAGNAFGTILTDVFFRGLEMTSDEIDTAHTVVSLPRTGTSADRRGIDRRSYIDSGRADKEQQARRACY
jgi:hypothetical protein